MNGDVQQGIKAKLYLTVQTACLIVGNSFRMLVAGGLASSRSDARRAVEQGGVTVKGDKVTDIKTVYTKDEIASEEFIVKKGKKNFKKIVVE